LNPVTRVLDSPIRAEAALVFPGDIPLDA
jgi:hypothetical protein